MNDQVVVWDGAVMGCERVAGYAYGWGSSHGRGSPLSGQLPSAHTRVLPGVLMQRLVPLDTLMALLLHLLLADFHLQRGASAAGDPAATRLRPQQRLSPSPYCEHATAPHMSVAKAFGYLLRGTCCVTALDKDAMEHQYGIRGSHHSDAQV